MAPPPPPPPSGGPQLGQIRQGGGQLDELEREDDAEAAGRDELRYERKRERERERRMENKVRARGRARVRVRVRVRVIRATPNPNPHPHPHPHPNKDGKRSKMTRDSERDVSERIALGQVDARVRARVRV